MARLGSVCRWEAPWAKSVLCTATGSREERAPLDRQHHFLLSGPRRDLSENISGWPPVSGGKGVTGDLPGPRSCAQ